MQWIAISSCVAGVMPLSSIVAFVTVALVAVASCTCTTSSKSCRQELNRNNGSAERECEVMCRDGHCRIRAGIILPKDKRYFGNLRDVTIVLDEAAKAAKRRQIFPGNLDVEFYGFDDQCNSQYATLSSIDAYEKCIHVLFGPICDYCLASAARITKFLGSYGTPLITAGGFSFELAENKTTCDNEYYMMLSTGRLKYNTMGKFFRTILDLYNWKKVMLIYYKDDQSEVAGEHACHLLMTSIVEHLKNDIEVAHGNMNIVGNVTTFLKEAVGVKYAIVGICGSQHHVRQILLEAESLQMMDRGEYLFINTEFYNNASIPSMPWYSETDPEETNRRAQKAYSSLLTLTVLSEGRRTERNETTLSNFYLDDFYDAMLLLADGINRSLTEAPAVTIRGTDLVSAMWGTRFEGKHGPVQINCNGDRISDYAMMGMNKQRDGFTVIGIFSGLTNGFELVDEVYWPHGTVPADTPLCGYDLSKCPSNISKIASILIICGILIVLVTLVSFSIYIYRRYRLETEISSMAWKINCDQLKIVDVMKLGSFYSFGSNNFGSQTTLVFDERYVHSRQIFTKTGYYQGIRVSVKEIREDKYELNRAQLIELKQMKDLSHDHLVKFFGVCLDSPIHCIVTQYCPRGSLQDILENEQLKLELVFKLSLIHDLIRGMEFLHGSVIQVHGNLKSSNCVVDSKFVLKITDFGIHFLRIHAVDGPRNKKSYAYWKRLLWTAPELLKLNNCKGTQKGDVYSFGIIVHEIIYRMGVFYLGTDVNMSPKEVVDAVRHGPQPLRPLLDDNCDEAVATMMKRCWADETADRPDFPALKTIIRKLNKEYDSSNILDNLLSRMEQYANNLETLVEERTADYLEEKRKCEELLYQLLPKSVALQLILGQSVSAETFDQVTIYFSDIVGFTTLSAESTPLQVVDLLNDLYTCFDSIIENFDVYKVETIGDGYMVVSGLPERNNNNHVREIARMALALLSAVKKFSIRHRPGLPLKLRIGIHTGPVVAGVVGLKMPRYCLFGDTVNTASRMESTGQPLKIHVSPASKEMLDRFGTFVLECRGEVEIKGKGKMITYWLKGERSTEPVNSSILETSSALGTPSRTLRSTSPQQSDADGKTLSSLSRKDPVPNDDSVVPLLSVTAANESANYSNI